MTSKTKKDASGIDLPHEDDELHRAVRQERINAEILKAVEMLGDRLARSEARRSELEGKVKDLESRPRALINLPVLKSPALPAVIGGGNASAQSMSLGRLALVAGISAFIVTAGFGLGVLYGQTKLPAGSVLVAARDDASTYTKRTPSADKTELAALVAGSTADGAPVPFSSLAAQEDARDDARKDGMRPVAPALSMIPQSRSVYDTVAGQAQSVTQPVIRMGTPQPVDPEATDVTARPAPLPEVEVAAVKATPPQDTPEAEPAAEAPVETASVREEAAPPPAQITAVDPASLPAEKFAKPGRDKSLPEKVKKIEQGAFDGVGEAQHDLATYYVSGQDGVGVDFKRAAYWFQQSAAAGVANGAYNLGVMYQQGLGVGPNVDMALKWYMEAAQLGHPEAQYNLGVAYAEGQGLQPNMQRAVSFFEQASEQGVSPAAFNLGLIYENGLLGRADGNKAAEWYKQAAIMGHDEARAAWERLTGEDFDSMIASINAGAARAANSVAPAAGGASRRGPEVADINVMDQEAHHTMVRQVQEELIRLKLIPGPADGMESPILNDAISAYERKNGLDITGKPSRDLLRRLRQ